MRRRPAVARMAHTLVLRCLPPLAPTRHAAANSPSGGRHASPADRPLASTFARTVTTRVAASSRHAVGAAAAPDDGFLANQDFESVGYSPAVAAGLRAAGLDRPSVVQAAAARPILAGRDTVVAAQTGSGKTLAYLAPLVTRLLEGRGQGGGGDAAAENPPPPLGLLILTPNAALCDQVVTTISSFLPGIVTAARVGGGGPDGGTPKSPPDVLVATPAGLLSATGPGAPASWSPDTVIARTTAVVVDEADALLGGGFARDTRRVLDALTAADADAAAADAASWAGLGEDSVASLPLRERRAARGGGAAALAREWGAEGVASRSLPPPPPRPPVRQYVFCGATLPEDPRMVDGPYAPPRTSRRAARDAPAGAWLRARWPRAQWVAADTLHAPPGSVRLEWVTLTEDGHGDEWAAALAAAVGTRGARTLVFAATAAAVRDAVAALATAGITAAPYSSSEPPAARAAALAAFKGEMSGDFDTNLSVLVATDAAARGLDIPGVAHVVQADFAPNAVDWLHRVGRTGRAGGGGQVTCLVPPASRPLADALRSSVEDGGAVDGAFSRKRSFRAKLKRYGEFVPRGEAGPKREGG